MPKPKYKLHASKVDRIAIVDNPCVPDAEIVVFKRWQQKETKEGPQAIEKQILPSPPMAIGVDGCCTGPYGGGSFETQIIPGMVRQAVDSISNVCYGLVMDGNVSEPDKVTTFKAEYGKFKQYVQDAYRKMAAIVNKGIPAGKKITTEQVLKEYQQNLLMSAVSNAYIGLQNALINTLYARENIEDPEGAATAIMEEFEKAMSGWIQQGTELTKALKTEAVNALTAGQEPHAIIKIGRKIAAHRLNKLKDAVVALTEIIQEADVVESEKEPDMTKEEKALLEKVAADVASLAADVQVVKAAQDKHEKMLADVGTTKTEIEKRMADNTVIEKKAAEDTAARVTTIEGGMADVKKAIDSFSKFVAGIEKRLGVKTSMEPDGAPGGNTHDDPFGKALKK